MIQQPRLYIHIYVYLEGKKAKGNLCRNVCGIIGQIGLLGKGVGGYFGMFLVHNGLFVACLYIETILKVR